ncbi:3-dehydroquinate synthase [Sneathiella sp.]|uniref:3-dehydroquinate synthase n=1 Tax=Sneathiella sp. TaxID=1964365 RepID=UPI002602AE89|nr:3-dehydroquinate synthase [Sneathiella sp.]MDF2365721.1 3-dehydroquinate synthase [Sneathiella sp.]
MTSLPAESASTFAEVQVALGARSYNILIGTDLIGGAGATLRNILKNPRVAVVTDENVAAVHLESLQTSLTDTGIEHSALVFPAGEGSKSIATYSDLMSRLLDSRIQRDEALIALGGGVIGDLTGFAAATLRRGVDFIQIPTTLLSQVDSSVGGKTGVNAPQGKNLIGAFYQPRLVLADISTLDSLPHREVLAGYAEVVKYGLLGDYAFFEWLEANGRKVIEGDTAARIYAVEQSVKAKARIVALDEREGGVRALLNLGHTFGHALEAETGYGPHLNHGEAVATGMIMAAELSVSLGLLNRQDCGRIRAHFISIGLPVAVPKIDGITWTAEKLLAHMRQDKKISGGKITLILMNAIGDAFSTKTIDESDILSLLRQELQE